MQQNAGRDIAIVGGGIGGLTAALAFARMDARVTLYERAPALTEVGAGLQITPNGARVLEKLDLGGATAMTGLKAQAVVPTDGLSGQQIARFDLAGQTPAYRFFHRAALVDLLGRACEAQGVTVRLGCEVTPGPTPDEIIVEGKAVTADLIVGADGLKSAMRARILPKADPFFTGQVAWRAMIRQADAAPEARIWMLPGRHVVTYPLPNGRLNIVAVQERADWAEEGWHQPDDPANLRTAFDDASEALTGLLEQVETTNLWGLFRHPVAQTWSKGRVVLLGDAAHPTLPFLAQGANLAIEDAWVLAKCCDTAERLEEGLAAYEAARKPRVRKAIAAANANARNYHLSGAKRTVAHAGLRGMARFAPNMFMNRLSWLYDHDVTA